MSARSAARPALRARVGGMIASLWARPELRWLTAILMIATALRVVWVLYAAREPHELHDPLFYFLYGEQIASGNGYRLLDGSPTAYYPIGYPAALGGVFALVKHTPIPDNLVYAATFFNVALGIATVAAAYLVGRRLFGTAVGLIAAAWIALFPNLIFHTGAYLTETLFNFVIMSAFAVLLWTSWREGRVDRWRLVVFGLLLGSSALVRPISLLFLPILLVVWLGMRAGWRRSLEQTAVVVVATVAVIAPWTVRNIIVMDSPVIISTNMGDNLCMGHHEGARGTFALPDHCFAGYEDLERPEYETVRDRENREKAIEFALAHPATEIALLARKARWTYVHDHDGLWAVESYGHDEFIQPDLRRVLEGIADAYYFVTLAVGGIGLAGLVWPRLEARRVFFLLSLISLALIPLAFFGDVRFHVPAMPPLAICAALACVAGARALPAWRSGGLQAGRSAVVEVTEGERAVPEEDALQDT